MGRGGVRNFTKCKKKAWLLAARKSYTAPAMVLQLLHSEERYREDIKC